MTSALELTILMPCLNEEETLAACVQTANQYLNSRGLAGEVLVADNGSTDRSAELARANGARVIDVSVKGYGAALMAGIEAAEGEYVVMGDADESYDFSSLDPFMERLRNGADLVMGNRFAGGIQPGAMPWHHRYIGNPILSWVGRRFFRTEIRDFHCGLRGMNRASALALHLSATGMEFASEMVAKSVLAGQRVEEVATVLRKDGRSRAPHLRSFRDGWRHLRFLLLFSPDWLYLFPGGALLAVGLLLTGFLVLGPVQIGAVAFDVGTLIYSAAIAVIGYQAVLFGLLAKVYASTAGFIAPGRIWQRFQRYSTLEVGLVIGLILLLLGVASTVVSFLRWRDVGYGALATAQHIRVVLPASLGLILGFQTVLGVAFLGAMSVARRTEPLRAGVDDLDDRRLV